MSVSFQTCRCFCVQKQKVERRLVRLSNDGWSQVGASIFSSHRRTITGEVSLSIRSHFACVFDHRNIKYNCALLQSAPTSDSRKEDRLHRWVLSDNRTHLGGIEVVSPPEGSAALVDLALACNCGAGGCFRERGQGHM